MDQTAIHAALLAHNPASQQQPASRLAGSGIGASGAATPPPPSSTAQHHAGSQPIQIPELPLAGALGTVGRGRSDAAASGGGSCWLSSGASLEGPASLASVDELHDTQQVMGHWLACLLLCARGQR